MPQLMPLLWVSSVLMWMLIFMILIELFYGKSEYIIFMELEKDINDNNLFKW